MNFYRGLPLFIKIVIAAILGVILGLAVGKDVDLKPVSDLVLQLLRLLATPLILFSVVHSLLTTNVRGRTVGRLIWVLLSNSAMASVIGLVVATALIPGANVKFPRYVVSPLPKTFDPVSDFIGRLPKDFVSPFVANDLIGIIVIALGVGIALRGLMHSEHAARIEGLAGWVKLGLDVTLKMLHWAFELVPLAVLAIVAHIVGTAGFEPLVTMVRFTLSVIFALGLMCVFYAVRLRLSSRIRPAAFVKGGFDAFALAFSTASSAATLPLTYACATEKLGIKDESAGIGIMVGGAFNHDGGALYQSMAALFVAQAIGRHLSLSQVEVILLMSVFASVATAGIPEAGLVMMIAVFSSVQLPIMYVPLLLPLDWLLDRFRTTINVVGDLVATCIIDSA